MTNTTPQPIEGRSCGTCTLCCKTLGITALSKPKDRWCQHCEIGRGCKIYDQRPAECQDFYCGYLTWPVLGHHWFPAACKMVVFSQLEGRRTFVAVDPGRPSAWREEPFYSEIKQWSNLGSTEIVVTIGRRVFVVFPDRDVDLGLVAEGELITVGANPVRVSAPRQFVGNER